MKSIPDDEVAPADLAAGSTSSEDELIHVGEDLPGCVM
jgi:hypothetical protein